MGVGEEGFLYPIDRLLHERGFALHIPRPRHRGVDAAAQEAFKKPFRRGPADQGGGAEGEASG
ncbi:winged helix-turn-helix domain-containing protein, partial [Thermus antranikianii]